MSKTKYKVGDTVQLKNNPRAGTARIELFYGESIKGGVRLDRVLNGFKSWNVDDLQKVDEKGKQR